MLSQRPALRALPVVNSNILENVTVSDHRSSIISIDQAQAEFAKLPNNASKKRAALTRSVGFIVTEEGADHFLAHRRKDLLQSDPQLTCVLDPAVAEHPIFAEFDASCFLFRFFSSRCLVQKTTSYPHLRLYKAMELGKRYDEIPANLVARSLDGNTTGSYPGNVVLGKRRRHAGDQKVGAAKTKGLTPDSEAEVAAIRAELDAITDDGERAALARKYGFIPVTLKDGTKETVHMYTAHVPAHLLGYVPFPAHTTIETLLLSAPRLDPATYSIAMDKNERAIVERTERIDIERLVWLIATGVQGINRENVLEKLELAPPKTAISFIDGNSRNCKFANLRVKVSG